VKRIWHYKKEIVVCSIFAAMAVFAVCNIVFIRNLTGNVIRLARESLEAGQRDEWEKAEELANAALDLWDAYDARTHVVLRHQSIENADVALAQHVGLISDENLDEAFGSYRGVEAVMKGISELETVRWGSVF